MKITDIRVYNLRYPLEEPFANSIAWNTARTAGVIEVITDAGVTGWGEGVAGLNEKALRARLVGRDPFDIEVVWNDLYLRGGVGFSELSAVDIALWDIVGRALEMPIYRLLGGAFRERIPAYASGLFKQRKADMTLSLIDEAGSYVDLGFPAVKMKIGFGADYDAKNVAAVRGAIGDSVQLAVDANCGYDTGTAIAVGRRLLENDLLWFEEPISTDDVAGYREIRQALGVRVAGGEALQGRWAFRSLIQERGLDIVQPDISDAGGFTECRKVAALASANHVRVLPHMWGTSIRLAATIHWQATLPDAPDTLNPFPSLFEFDMTENRLRTELSREPIQAMDGYVSVIQQPGLGIEIDREVLEEYAVSGTEH
jgi:D-galactarolactone cycloisomerase